jgi:hypothetical protein
MTPSEKVISLQSGLLDYYSEAAPTQAQRKGAPCFALMLVYVQEWDSCERVWLIPPKCSKLNSSHRSRGSGAIPSRNRSARSVILRIIRMVLTRNFGLLIVFASPQLTKTQNPLWVHLNHAQVLFLPAHGECTLESHNEFAGSDFQVEYALYPKLRRRSWIIACSQRRVRVRWPIIIKLTSNAKSPFCGKSKVRHK